MAPHSDTLAWKIPWMEEPDRLQSMGSQRVGHNWATSLSLFTFMPWRRKWQPTPVFLPGKSQGWGSLVENCICRKIFRWKLITFSWNTRTFLAQVCQFYLFEEPIFAFIDFLHCFLFSILLICALIFIIPSTWFRFRLLLFFQCLKAEGEVISLRSFFSVLLLAFTAIDFPLSTALAAFHKFWCVMS